MHDSLPTASDVVRPDTCIAAFHNTLTRPFSTCPASEFCAMDVLWPTHRCLLHCNTVQ